MAPIQQPLGSARRCPPNKELAFDHLGGVEYERHACQPLWPQEVEPEMQGFAEVVHKHLGELQRSVKAYPRCHVELSFPMWLNSYERYLIHRFTDCYELLRHHSSDGAKGRRLYVFGGQNVEYADRIARFKLEDKQLRKVASANRPPTRATVEAGATTSPTKQTPPCPPRSTPSPSGPPRMVEPTGHPRGGNSSGARDP